MEKELKRAVNLRKEDQKVESNRLLVELVKNHPDDPVINYQCAWSFDILGKPSKGRSFL